MMGEIGEIEPYVNRTYRQTDGCMDVEDGRNKRPYADARKDIDLK
jgi:hypothetical protein